jgi:ubiquinone/menaquinone biosynthesis C-methylase UbiE
MMTIDEAVRQWRADPAMQTHVRDAYMDRDVLAAAHRFLESGEFAQVRHLLAGKLQNAWVVDVGAGAGIASFAFVRSGARRVTAIEPDPSDEVGQGAMQRLPHPLSIDIVSAFADHLPLENNSVDIVFVRQVLHHLPDLNAAMLETARILKPGGVFLACREHVVDDAEQKAAFLNKHPMHQLAQSENAYSLPEYQGAITSSGMRLVKTFLPWETVINAFPEVRTQEEIAAFFQKQLKRKFGMLGAAAAMVPGSYSIMRYRFNRSKVPGRMVSFMAVKPA